MLAIDPWSINIAFYILQVVREVVKVSLLDNIHFPSNIS